jgi:hypothetical protein
LASPAPTGSMRGERREKTAPVNSLWTINASDKLKVLFGRTYCCCGWFVGLICCERKILFP